MRRTKSRKNKMRSSTRVIYMLIALVLFAISSSFLYKSYFMKRADKVTKEIFNYKNEFKANYSVNIKPNKFVEEESLPMNQTYVTALMDSVNMDLSYGYTSSEKGHTEYEYNVVGILQAKYDKSGTDYEVWNKEFELKDKKFSSTDENKFTIKENVIIDVKTYNSEVNEFKQTLGMDVDAKLIVKLIVKTTTTVDNKEVFNTYTSNVEIELGEKVTNITGNLIDEQPGYIVKDTIEKTSGNKILVSIINIPLLLVSIYVMYYITFKTKSAHNIKNTYKLELNKILRACQDKIVSISKAPNINEETVVEVKEFGELIKLSEELFKPILYWPLQDKQEAWFCVMSNYAVYRYILK